MSPFAVRLCVRDSTVACTILCPPPFGQVLWEVKDEVSYTDEFEGTTMYECRAKLSRLGDKRNDKGVKEGQVRLVPLFVSLLWALGLRAFAEPLAVVFPQSFLIASRSACAAVEEYTSPGPYQEWKEAGLGPLRVLDGTGANAGKRFILLRDEKSKKLKLNSLVRSSYLLSTENSTGRFSLHLFYAPFSQMPQVVANMSFKRMGKDRVTFFTQVG